MRRLATHLYLSKLLARTLLITSYAIYIKIFSKVYLVLENEYLNISEQNPISTRLWSYILKGYKYIKNVTIKQNKTKNVLCADQIFFGYNLSKLNSLKRLFTHISNINLYYKKANAEQLPLPVPKTKNETKQKLLCLVTNTGLIMKPVESFLDCWNTKKEGICLFSLTWNYFLRKMPAENIL